MPRRLVFLLAMGLAPVTPGMASPAAADDDIARRLGALKALLAPIEARRALESDTDPGACGSSWWQLTDYGVRSRIDTAVRDASLRYVLDPELLRAVIRHESNYQVRAVSHKGAQGLMQLMPATARELGVICAFDPRENVLGGARYLRRLRDRLGSWPRALAGYHAGPRAVQHGRIPDETRRYVQRILRSWRPERVASMRFD
jgi:soluble lytic murein transglycosylase-like protein